MAERKPVVLVGGQLTELPAGDTLPPQTPAAHAHACVYIQEADPMAATPYIWYRTDAMGVVIDILKG